MTRVRIEHVELGEELGPQLRTLRPTRHDVVRILLCSAGRPVGWVQLPNESPSLRPAAIVEAAAERIAPQVWASLEAAPPAAAKDGASPAIDVVVCTRNRPRDLERCLAALVRQDYESYRIIVVDNAPDDDATRQVAQRFGATYAVERRRGLDNARNCGLRAADAELVAYTDDDVVVSPGWLSGIARAFVADDVGCATGLVVPAELETADQLLFEDVYGGMGKGFAHRVVSYRRRRLRYLPHELGAGCNMAFRRTALDEIGGFDPALDTGTPTGGAGDLDAFQRILESGRAVVYRADAIVSHRHRRTRTGLRRQLFDNGRGYASFYLTALLRARGLERARVAGAAVRWYLGWLVLRVWRKLRRRERLPMSLILAELAGGTAGPYYFLRARLRLRRRRSQSATATVAGVPQSSA